MSVGNIPWPIMHPIPGITWGVASAGIKKIGKIDLALMAIASGSAVAGVFTRNAFCAEPVKLCKQHMASDSARYFVINSGNANACTGAEGMKAAQRTCAAMAELGSVSLQQVLPFSTGVIGEVLAAEKICVALPSALNQLSSDAWDKAAAAIMTTDTLPKGASIQFAWRGKEVSITGICKGAGMIKPNMGTMLAFVATDAAISPSVLNTLAKQAANTSFNRITIDGDTSTNDAAMLIATGQANTPLLENDEGDDYREFLDQLTIIYQNLAQQIVRDGEGATKFVKIKVSGGGNQQECLDVAYAIAHSPLVKTAMFASDPNWGRIVAALGNADVPDLVVEKIKVWLDDVLIVEQGGRASTYQEAEGQRIFQQAEFTIAVDLGRGDCSEQLWTSDLSHEYIKINAEYRT